LNLFEKDLKVKITIILLVFIIVAVGASMIISRSLVTFIIKDNVQQSMGDAARLTRNIVEVGLERRTTRIELLASLPAMRDPNAPPALRLETLTLFTEGWPIGQEAIFVDTDGNIICGTGKVSTLATASGTSWFDNAQLGGTAFTYIGNPSELTAAFFKSPVLAVSTPVRDANNQIFGYVVAFTNIKDITRAVSGVLLEKTGHGFLLSESGQLVAGRIFPAVPRPGASDKSTYDNLVAEMTRGRPGQTSVTYAGRGYLVSWTPVESSTTVSAGLDWTVGVSVPSAEAYQPANQVTVALLLLALVLIALGTVAAVLLGRSITRPIDELVATAERVGSGDLTGEVPVRTRDQVGKLAAAFLRMRDYLRGAITETGYAADKMSLLADEQSAGTEDVFTNTEEIVDSVVVMARNMESLTQKLGQVMELSQKAPEQTRNLPEAAQVRDLLQACQILAEVGANKAIEIASATQDQRAAARDVSAAARRLSEMARELNAMVQKFKV
jgi:methyl-accepting chemotaxis protein